MNENEYYLSSREQPIERFARSEGPPSLKRRWLARWAREWSGLARAIVTRGRIMGMAGNDWDLIESFLYGWEPDLQKALFSWGMGERPSLAYYESWGLGQFAEPESYYQEE